jgi:two-component system, NarL family, nitrate/nitrite response regulator NarL
MDETVSGHTVVVADDHESYRKGLARAIDACDGLRLVGQASDGAEALELIDALAPELALLDVRMPKLDGLEVCRRLQGSGVRTVLLSAYASDALEERAQEVGAAACLSKEATRTDICETLLRVAADTG